MGDRFFDDLERFFDDLQIELSSYSVPSMDDYDVEDEEMGGDYEVEEVNDVGIEEKSEELACPFCLEDFDVLGLCCHIDADHRLEVKPGICPVCATKVRINMASHVITHHESILKDHCNKRHRNGRARSSIIMLKEMQDKHLHLIKESPSVGSSSDAAADSLLLSFVNSPQTANRPQTIETDSPVQDGLSAKSSDDGSLERMPPSLSTDMNNESVRRCEFVQGLLLSTILDDL